MVIGTHYVLFALYATVFIFLVKFNLLSDHLGSSCSFAYHMLSWYKYLIVNLVFSHLGGNFFPVVPFHDHCPLSPLYKKNLI